MKIILAAAALALAPAAALAADVSGAWTVNGAFGDEIKYTAVCTFKQDAAGKLAGSCKQADAADDAASTGQTDGSKVEFAYDTTYQGSPYHLDYKGDLQPDGTISGTVDAGGPQGTFTAKRQ
jgi:hypothetical protein